MTVTMIPEATQELVERVKAGDRAAYGQLVERFSDRLSAMAHARVGPALRGQMEIDDVVQESLRLALESLEQFEWRGEDSFVRWLGTIAENVIRKAARTEARKPGTEQILEISSDSTSPSTHLRRQERFERLERALASLPADYREVIRLSRIEGLKIKEIAERMERSPDAVKQLVVRALRRLKRSFGDTESLHLPNRRLDLENQDG